MRRYLVLAALLLTAQDPLAAQAKETGAGTTKLLGGAHYVTATGPTLHLAVMRIDRVTTHSEGGYFVSAEGGLGGGKVGVGTGGSGPFGSAMIRVSYLRSWGEDGSVERGQGYVGADLRIGIRSISVGAGWHARVSGDAPDDGSVLSLSAGIGF